MIHFSVYTTHTHRDDLWPKKYGWKSYRAESCYYTIHILHEDDDDDGLFLVGCCIITSKKRLINFGYAKYICIYLKQVDIRTKCHSYNKLLSFILQSAAYDRNRFVKNPFTHTHKYLFKRSNPFLKKKMLISSDSFVHP